MISGHGKVKLFTISACAPSAYIPGKGASNVTGSIPHPTAEQLWSNRPVPSRPKLLLHTVTVIACNIIYYIVLLLVHMFYMSFHRGVLLMGVLLTMTVTGRCWPRPGPLAAAGRGRGPCREADFAKPCEQWTFSWPDVSIT
jgi:hypothetical protein